VEDGSVKLNGPGTTHSSGIHFPNGLIRLAFSSPWVIVELGITRRPPENRAGSLA
jgi:hypothetical protein